MNRDMRNTMRADRHPEIRLEVFRIDLLPDPPHGQIVHADQERIASPEVEIHGAMALAGVSKDIMIRMQGWLDEDLRLHGTGVLHVKMTDFEMQPPTALFGLIKAHDDISIRFHLVADTSMDIGEAVTTPAVTPIETVVQGTGNIQ